MLNLAGLAVLYSVQNDQSLRGLRRSERRVRKRDKKSEKRCDLRRQQKMERIGAAVTAIEECSTDERLQQETLCSGHWTDDQRR